MEMLQRTVVEQAHELPTTIDGARSWPKLTLGHFASPAVTALEGDEDAEKDDMMLKNLIISSPIYHNAVLPPKSTLFELQMSSPREGKAAASDGKENIESMEWTSGGLEIYVQA
ncbi:hypothetical protein L6164_008638 [Bauhinia variegata]|uniref:Uncharacterized protein n=1 Tax=Bauhinia variegata TaxID=167791 RepID=A0ACB9PHD4_BAUVA|nr:hypothetical protein L6164_008638 [Bauhinia variegata]